MEIRFATLNFPRLRGGGPRTATQAVVFPREVERAAGGLIGFSAGFRGDDHHLGILNVQSTTQINANVVAVSATFGLRDWSGAWDDDYAGSVEVVVLADLVPAGAGPSRGDLIIVDMEITQAIQFFRSASHLDGPNIQADNSIPLVGGKDTGVRVYVDHDANSGLPAIGTLSGELEVRTASGATAILLRPLAPIVPRRESQIHRGNATDTLNFMIPGAWCRDQLELRCRVFDAALPVQRSPLYSKTIRFRDVTPLRVYGVGVHYTGQGLNLAAPSDTDMINTLGFTRRTYPTGDVLLSGFSEIDFDVDMNANIANGCGHGFGELLDRLRDMRGDSDDLYYGLLPAGINTGSVGGCGGGGVGAGFVNAGPTAAHEAGHALGRAHAPCVSATVCDNPANEDDGYPDYDTYPSDSIGEFGFDPTRNQVFDPAGTSDFMSYSPNVWVSPYTYRALMARLGTESGGSWQTDSAAFSLRRMPAPVAVDLKPPDSNRPEWIRRKEMILFLRLSVDRDRKVTTRGSFHYPAFPSSRMGAVTDFRVEIQDGDGRTLACVQLRELCAHCARACWPKHFRPEIPFPPRGKRLTVWEGDKKIHEAEIPDPPVIRLTKKEYVERDQAVTLEWTATDGGKGGGELTHLVQWLDDFDVWRGLAPRSRETFARIPVRLFPAKGPLRVRILASSGIATGILEEEVQVVARRVDPQGPLTLHTGEEEGVLRVHVVDSKGREIPNPDIAWFDQQGSEIGRGRSLDTRNLPEGQHLVRAAALHLGAGKVEATWLFEKLAGPQIRIDPKLLQKRPPEAPALDRKPRAK